MIPTQCKAARSLLEMHQETLAERAGVSRKTLADFEGGNSTPYKRTLADIRHALEAAGVEFLDADNGGPGVRLKKTVARLLRRRVFIGDRRVTFVVDYGGEEIECRFNANVLDDWDRTNHKTKANFEQSFDAHANTIIVRAQGAIEAGRAKDGTLVLTAEDDFPEVG